MPVTHAPRTEQPLLTPHNERRRFLKRVSALGAALSGILVGVPVLRAFLSPAFPRTRPDNWMKVADDVAVLEVGAPVRLDFVRTVNDAWVESRVLTSVWVYTEDGANFKAYNGRCTHLGCGYTFDDKQRTFRCPCHEGVFNVKTGAVISGPPPRGLDELDVKLQDSALYVRYRDFRPGIAERVEV